MFKSRVLVELSARAARLEVELDEERGLRRNAELALHQLEIKNAVLMERLDLTSNYLTQGTAPRLQGPTSMPEEAEDALFAFRQGDIDKGQLERQLAAAGYDNTEIEFELSDYPRHAVEQ
jgi:hypothetical protein